MQGLSATCTIDLPQAAIGAGVLFLDHERPDGADKILLGGPVLDQGRAAKASPEPSDRSD